MGTLTYVVGFACFVVGALVIAVATYVYAPCVFGAGHCRERSGMALVIVLAVVAVLAALGARLTRISGPGNAT